MNSNKNQMVGQKLMTCQNRSFKAAVPESAHKSLLPQLEKAVDYHQHGLVQLAKRSYKAVLKELPGQPDAMHLLGVLEFECGNYEQAISLISKAIQSAPGQPAFYSNLGNAFRSAGCIQKAIACYQKSIALDPYFHMAHYNLALAFRQSDHLIEAEAVLKRTLKCNPDWSKAWFLLGDLLNENGKTDEAVDYFQRALEINPDIEQAWFFLGNAYRSKKEFQKAEACYRRALVLKPDFTECLNNLGLTCFNTDRFSEAVDLYEKALRYRPKSVEVLFNLGNTFYALGQSEKARCCYLKAIDSKPDYSSPMAGMGRLNYENGKFDKAFEWYRQAHSLNPLSWQLLEQLGNSKRMAGDIEAAMAYYLRALKIKPNAHTVLISIGNAHRQLKNMGRAISAYQRALEYKPNSLTTLNNLAIALTDVGKTEEAVAIFDRMLSIEDKFSTCIKKTMTLPIIYPSAGEMQRSRQDFISGIKRLEKTGASVEDPYHDIGIANFILALHGVNEKPIRQLIAQFYLTVCPQLAWSAPQLKTKKTNRKIRLGIVCRYLKNHTIGRLYLGMIETLDKTRFELVVFRFDQQTDTVSRSVDRCAGEVVVLPQDIFKARERIAEAELDILFFPEIGMDPLTYFIAFSRLAPVQCKRGFQITMGIPTIDYFISSDSAEPTDGQRYYSEKLVCLKGTGYYYRRPEMPVEKPERASYDLPEDRTLYICTQSLFKLHPDFDPVLAAILDKDPRGVLILLEGMHPNWKKLLLERFKKTVPGIIDRIYFVQRQSRYRFMNLHLLADAVIDTLYFSGGHTSLECFAWGVPVVTWPSAMLPGRLTYGFYKRMGVMDCVARDLSDYVDIAYRLANDLVWREEISQKIFKKSSILFENINDIRELELFFEKAVNDAYRLNSNGQLPTR